MFSYTATIGRNVPVTDPTLPQRDDVTGERIQAPMTLTRWEQFVEDVKADMLHAIPSDICELHRGKGVWDGVEEESAKITLLRHFPFHRILNAIVQMGICRIVPDR